MIWDSLIGQPPAKAYLRSVLTSRRMAHAFLFKGAPGIGKRTAAYLFAQVIMCHNPPAPDLACGQCKSCRWFAARNGSQIDHPDVISLVKFSGESKGEKLVGDHEPIIPLETIQHVCEQLHRTPMSGEHRTVIIPDAQRLCRGQAEAANAFLKTLEEPPQASLIILTSSQPEGLLETIISRVQGVQFRRLSVDEVKSGLQQKAADRAKTRTVLPAAASPKPAKKGSKAEVQVEVPAPRRAWDAAEINAAATLSDGSLGRALELLDGDLNTWRSAVLKALEKFDKRRSPEFGLMLWGLADVEGKRLFEAEEAREDVVEADPGEENEADNKTESGWKRYVFRRLLELCEVCFRDGLVRAAVERDTECGAKSSGEVPLLQPDQSSLSVLLAKRFGEEGCQKVLAALREALFAVRLYVRGDVVARALSGKMVDASEQ